MSSRSSEPPIPSRRECLSNGPEVSTSARTKSPRDQLRERHHKALAIPLVGADEAVVGGARGQLSRPRRAVMSHRLPVLSCLMRVSQWIGSRQTRPVGQTLAFGCTVRVSPWETGRSFRADGEDVNPPAR